MSKISNWIWTEIVILIGLFIAFLAGLLDAKTYASVAIGVFVVFAVPAFFNMAKTKEPEGDNS